MDENQKHLDTFEIPANAISNSYFFGIHFTHWIEAIIFVFLTDYGIWHINFVPKVKWIVISVLTIALGFVFLSGIKGRTLTQAIIYAIIGLKKRKEYHLGGINNDRKTADMAEFAGQSGAEQLATFFKQELSFLEKRYGQEPEEDNSEETDSPN